MEREETTHMFVRVMDLYDKYFMTLHVNNKMIAKAECSSHEEALRLAMEAWQGYKELVEFKSPKKETLAKQQLMITGKPSLKNRFANFRLKRLWGGRAHSLGQNKKT